jgi:hypothetical protein
MDTAEATAVTTRAMFGHDLGTDISEYARRVNWELAMTHQCTENKTLIYFTHATNVM